MGTGSRERAVEHGMGAALSGRQGTHVAVLWELSPGIDAWSPENPLMCARPLRRHQRSTSRGSCWVARAPPTAPSSTRTAAVLSVLSSSSPATTSHRPRLRARAHGRAHQRRRSQLRAGRQVRRHADGRHRGRLARRLRPGAMTSLSIGPAGEHKLPWACVSNDQYHKAGRGGAGALMGPRTSRRSPSPAPAGRCRRRPRVPRRRRAHRHRLHPHGRPTTGSTKRARLSSSTHRRGWLPAHTQLRRGYLRRCRQDQLRVVPEDPPQEARLLPVHARPAATSTSQGRQVRGPGVRDHRPLRLELCHRQHRRPHGVQHLVRRVGPRHDLDRQRSSALAMDITEKGIPIRPSFRRRGRLLKSPDRSPTGRRGAELALGTRALAEKYGHPELACRSRASRFPATTRGARSAWPSAMRPPTAAPATCARSRSARRSSRAPAGPHARGQGRLGGQHPRWGARTSLPSSSAASGATSGPSTRADRAAHEAPLGARGLAEELMRLGERVWNLGRLFNLREGYGKADDACRSAWPRASVHQGPAAGKVITRQASSRHRWPSTTPTWLGRERYADRREAPGARDRRAPLARRHVSRGGMPCRGPPDEFRDAVGDRDAAQLAECLPTLPGAIDPVDARRR